VSNQIWIALIVVALGTGLAIGLWIGARAARQTLADKLRAFEKDLVDQRARAAQESSALQAQAAREVEFARSQIQRQLEAARTEHRAETEQLARHLTEAYDELDKLRNQLLTATRTGASHKPEPDQGFAATMPMQDP
jgi:chromosome segregation ATPase